MKTSRVTFLSVLVLAIGVSVNASSKTVEFKSRIEFKTSGMAKYDDFLKTTKDLIDNFDKAEFAFSNVVPDVTDAVSGVYAVLGQTPPGGAADTAAVMRALIAELARNGITLKIGVADTGVELVLSDSGAGGALVGRVDAQIGNVRNALNTVVAIPKSVADIVENSKKAADQGKDLAGSAKSDFTGLNAMKLPGVVKSLNGAVDNLLQLPEKSVNLANAVMKFVNDLKTLAS